MSVTVFRNAYLYDGNLIANKYKNIVVSNGTIEYIGNDEVNIKNNANYIDGGYLLKSFCDYHFHLPGSKLFDLFGVNLSECDSVDEYKDVILNKCNNMSIIRGFGWDVEILRNYFIHSSLTPLEFLDCIVSDIPAIIFSLDFHSCWCNSKAIEMLRRDGISSIFKDKEIPNGEECIFHEEIANRIFMLPQFQFTDFEIEEATKVLQKELLAVGITEIFSLMFIGVPYIKMLNVLHKIDVMGQLKIKIFFSYTVYPSTSFEDLENGIKESYKFESEHLRFASIKLYIDGVIDNHSAFLNEPYADMDYCGESLWDKRSLELVLKYSSDFGLPAHIHAIGDAAVDFAVKRLIKVSLPRIGRHIITHLQLCDKSTMKLMARNDIVACMQPFWFYRGINACSIDIMRLGTRVKNEYPVNSLLSSGVAVLFSSDCPATSIFDPIVGIKVASGLDDSDENISKQESYKAYYAGAYRNESFELKQGDIATFVRMNCDLFSSEDSSIENTFVDGVMVYSKSN